MRVAEVFTPFTAGREDHGDYDRRGRDGQERGGRDYPDRGDDRGRDRGREF